MDYAKQAHGISQRANHSRIDIEHHFLGGHREAKGVHIPGLLKGTLDLLILKTLESEPMHGYAIARSIEARFHRVQFTPDLLPADILGVSIFNQVSREFEFQPGPVFTNILLADEINRASPRTQSALLEAMAEGQVSIEGHTHRLAEP